MSQKQSLIDAMTTREKDSIFAIVDRISIEIRNWENKKVRGYEIKIYLSPYIITENIRLYLQKAYESFTGFRDYRWEQDPDNNFYLVLNR